MSFRFLFLLLILTQASYATTDCITLDAGHGGYDPGTSSLNGRYHEKDLTLQTVLSLASALRQAGHIVKLTRSDDTFIPLQTRASIAHTNGCRFFISVHLNSYDNNTEGYETYYGMDSTKPFARFFHNKWITEMSTHNRGVHAASFHVVNPPKNAAKNLHELSNFFKAFQNNTAKNGAPPFNPDVRPILIEPYFLDNNAELNRYMNTGVLENILYETIQYAVANYREGP